MTLQDGLKLLRTKMNEHGLRGWTAKINTNKRRLGVCKWTKKRIELSAHHVLGASDKDILNTILHEIAHALVPVEYERVGRRRRAVIHGPAWQRKALEIGCNGERCGTSMGVPPTVKGTCPDCGHVFMKHRMGRKGSYHKECHLKPNKGIVVWTRV